MKKKMYDWNDPVANEYYIHYFIDLVRSKSTELMLLPVLAFISFPVELSRSFREWLVVN